MSKELRYLEIEDILNRDFYEFYKKEREKPCKGIDQYNYFLKSVSGIFLLIHENLESKKGGIYIKDFGYFYRKPCLKRRGYFKELRKRLKKHIIYKVCFIPFKKTEGWSFNATTQLPITDIAYENQLDEIELYRLTDKYLNKIARIKNIEDDTRPIYH